MSKKKFRPEKGVPNISVNEKNYKLLQQQQEIYHLLTKGDLVNNILDIYFKNQGDWQRRNDLIGDKEEREEDSTKGRRKSFK